MLDKVSQGAGALWQRTHQVDAPAGTGLIGPLYDTAQTLGITIVTEMKMQGGKVYSLVGGAWQEQGEAGGSFAPFGSRLKNGIAVVTTTEWSTGTEYTFEMNEKALAELNKKAPEGQQVLESSATYLVNPEGLLVSQRVTSRASVTVDGKSDVLFSETETTLTAWNQPDVTIE